MKYPYIVNHNGTWYPAGTEVPVGTDTVEKSVVAENKPTRTEIQQMRKATLVETAKTVGIDGADAMTSGELKSALIKAMGL